MNAVHPTLTTERRKWLRLLRDEGPHVRSKTRVGFDCMHLGWTEWVYRLKDTGAEIGFDELKARWPDEWMNKCDFTGLERITEEGRAVLTMGE